MPCCYKDIHTNVNKSYHSLSRRRGVRAKYKYNTAFLSKVIMGRCHNTFILNAIIFIDAVVITQSRAREMPGLLHNVVSKSWLCTQVSHTLLTTRILVQADDLRPALRHKDDVMHQNTPLPSRLHD